LKLKALRCSLRHRRQPWAILESFLVERLDQPKVGVPVTKSWHRWQREK